MKSRRLVAVGFTTLSLAGCHPPAVRVQQYGGMREVLMEGRSEPRISLADAVRTPHAFGIGALEALAGEITIIHGEAWVSRASAGEVVTTGPTVNPADQATLLTLANVPKWRRVVLSDDVEAGGLEETIERIARERGLDVERPFPFFIEGEMTALDLHVVAGSCPSAPASEANEPWRRSFDAPVRATLVGFFAKGQEGVMTHHGTSLHVHAVLRVDRRILSGHVDRVSLAAGSILRLPVCGTGVPPA